MIDNRNLWQEYENQQKKEAGKNNKKVNINTLKKEALVALKLEQA